MHTNANRALLLPLFTALLSSALGAQTHSANFDAQTEGSLGTSYTEDGIVFSNLDRYLGSSSENFVAEDGSGTLAGMTGFSAPNTLGFGGYSPGGGVGFSRCGVFDITLPGLFNSGDLAIFLTGGSTSGNLVTLEARLAGSAVASDTVTVPSTFGPHAFSLSVTGVDFDTLHLIGTGALHSGSFFAVVDNVHVTAAPLGSPYCFGDGTGTACPCGNMGAPGEGCANSTGSGSILAASGSASIAADDLLLNAGQLPPNKPVLLFAGSTMINGGLGVVFGDGLRCAGGTLRRLGVRTSDALGAATWGPNIASASGWNSGDTRYFQVWNRDPGGPCNTQFNVSHGLGVTFTP